MGTLHRFWRDERGATAIEYAVIAGSIALVIIVSLQLVGTRTATRFSTVAANLT